ncbi:MAG TPA: hypothetical protein VMM76_06995 [Pirellulaceae bacterium]|nr:hypothetical protein [Pirellulaceae bacterium]
MTTTSITHSVAVCGCFAIALTWLIPKSSTANPSESVIASADDCCDCPACDPPSSPAYTASARGCIDHFHRAGHPETQGKFAKPSLNKHYTFGYVGGGAAFRGEPRCPDEGTWGVDYSGILFKKKIWLQWLHGHREPRHDGSYQTDGPHVLSH